MYRRKAGSIQKVGPSTFELFYPLPKDANGKRRRTSKTIRGTLRDAEKAMRRLMTDLDAGLRPDSKLTVGGFLDRWLEECIKVRVNTSTYEKYRDVIDKHLKPALGSIKLEQLTPEQIQSIYSRWATQGRLDKRKGGLSPATVRKHHAVLHGALHTARKWRLVTCNVADLVELPKLEQTSRTPLETDAWQKLLNAATDPDDHAAVLCALGTGMRRGELLGLRWADVSFERQTITVARSLQSTKMHGLRFKAPKNGRARTFQAPAFVLEELRKYRIVQGKRRWNPDREYRDQNLIFATEAGDPIHPVAFSRSFRRLANGAGIGSIGPHRLRHTATTLMAEEGISPKLTADMLGHSTTRMTLDVYSHVTPQMQSDAAARIDRKLRPLVGKEKTA